MNDGRITYLAGVVGGDPEIKETRIGELLTFRLGVTVSYPKDGQQYGETEWYDVNVKHQGLQKTVMNEIYRGAKVMVQGSASVKEYNGKPQFSIWADRIGLVEFLRRDQVAQPAQAPASAPADDELGF